MSTKQMVALSLALVSSAAIAQSTFDAVEVRAQSEDELSIACNSPSMPRLQEVERVLAISDSTQTATLRNKLMGAAAEACKAGVSRIMVTRDVRGKSLTWDSAVDAGQFRRQASR